MNTDRLKLSELGIPGTGVLTITGEPSISRQIRVSGIPTVSDADFNVLARFAEMYRTPPVLDVWLFCPDREPYRVPPPEA